MSEDYPIIKTTSADGFRGIWYMNQPSDDPWRFKYSGGFATYPQQHVPIAVHAAEVGKTFFVYGGRPRDRNTLLHCVSCYDHKRHTLAQPRVLLDKQTDDAHDNPTLSIDPDGHLWIFSNTHGPGRPAFVHRSVEAYDFTRFERVSDTNFSYGQPWHLGRETGFCFLHTLYGEVAGRGGRFLHVRRSRDGRTWRDPQMLAAIDHGHYQISWPTPDRKRLGTAFNYHPHDIPPGEAPLNWRTNLYYLETLDGGATWRTAAGEAVGELPITRVDHPALAIETRSRGELCYLKDLSYDAAGRPVVLFLTARHWRSGPEGGPRIWRLARFDGSKWQETSLFESNHNYDFGSLYVEGDTWRILAATLPGPYAFNPGGEIGLWQSDDAGVSWRFEKALTQNSRHNHTYPRRPLDAQADFAALWADGNPRELSESRLYFATLRGDVFRMPAEVDTDEVEPEPV